MLQTKLSLAVPPLQPVPFPGGPACVQREAVAATNLLLDWQNLSRQRSKALGALVGRVGRGVMKALWKSIILPTARSRGGGGPAGFLGGRGHGGDVWDCGDVVWVSAAATAGTQLYRLEL